MATVLDRQFLHLTFEHLCDEFSEACRERGEDMQASGVFASRLALARDPEVLEGAVKMDRMKVASAAWLIYSKVWMSRSHSLRSDPPTHLFIPSLAFLLECERQLSEGEGFLNARDVSFALKFEGYREPIISILIENGREDLIPA